MADRQIRERHTNSDTKKAGNYWEGIPKKMRFFKQVDLQLAVDN